MRVSLDKIMDISSILGALGLYSIITWFICLIPTVVIVKHVWIHYDNYKFIVAFFIILYIFAMVA